MPGIMENDNSDARKNTFACNQCEYVAKKKFQLKEHCRSKHEGVVYPCDQCDYVTKSKKYLTEHVNSKHLGIQHVCVLCSKVFARPQYLRIHIKVGRIRVIFVLYL